MEAHVDKLQVTIKDRLSACHVIFVLDNSSNHTKCSDDAVLSRRMTVNPGTEALASVRCQQWLHSAIDAFCCNAVVQAAQTTARHPRRRTIITTRRVPLTVQHTISWKPIQTLESRQERESSAYSQKLVSRVRSALTGA